MKSIVLALTFLSSLSAHAILDSHYGTVKTKGFRYICQFTNTTGRTLDLKYVEFQFEGNGDRSFNQQVRIDKRVQPGDSIASSVTEHQAINSNVCRYWAR